VSTANPSEHRLARLTVRADLRYFPAVDRFVRSLAEIAGLDAAAVERLALIVEEALANVVEHAFLPGEEGELDVLVLHRPGQLVVAVEDQGLPFDPASVQPGEETGLGMTLMRAFADELRFVNLGKGGKRVELVKYLPARDVGESLSAEERAAVPLQEQAEVAKSDAPVSLRLMREDQAVDLARLVYRVYGYSYAGDFIYYPERIRERFGEGLMHSCVAVTEAGELVGHIGLQLERPDATIGEIAQAVVDPRFRGRKLFEQMQRVLLEHARSLGLYGAYSEAVTVHPYTQRGNLALGAGEIGLMFGYSPQKTVFKGINEHQAQRQTALLMYRNISPGPVRPINPPFHHLSMVQQIFAHNGLERILVSPRKASSGPPLVGHSSVEVRARPEWGHAVISVREFGADLLPLVKLRLRELCLNRIEAIFIDLPLGHPATAHSCAPLEALGFFFSGVIPEMSAAGDVLRLQYLNNVAIDPSRIQVASDFGRDLLDYVASQMAQGLAL